MPEGVNVRPTFEWDERKNQANISKHGFDFVDAAELFSQLLLARPDTREDYGEERWIGLGTVRGRVAVIAFTTRGPNTIRVISLRKASREEQKQYEKAIQDRLEAH